LPLKLDDGENYEIAYYLFLMYFLGGSPASGRQAEAGAGQKDEGFPWKNVLARRWVARRRNDSGGSVHALRAEFPLNKDQHSVVRNQASAASAKGASAGAVNVHVIQNVARLITGGTSVSRPAQAGGTVK
jgi:hypothetical protein